MTEKGKNIDVMPSLVVHTCCAPCLTIPEARLSSKFDIVSYYYNPNIHPFTEHRARLESLEKFAKLKNIRLIAEKPDYLLTKKFIKAQLANDENGKRERCNFCYDERLRRTVEYARANGYEFFTTSLLTSPYQYHDDIKALCERLAKEYGIKFVYEDFRKEYARSIELCREYGIYRQKYCGCVFSEYERYLKVKP